MRYAVLSDVHGNLEALSAVLADSAREGATGLICLGDAVGYGVMECIIHGAHPEIGLTAANSII